MILFRIVYIYDQLESEAAIAKRDAYFDQVQEASRKARNQTPTGFTPQEWLDNAYNVATKKQAEGYLKRK